MGRWLAAKLILAGVGTGLVWAADRVGVRWLFVPGLALVIVALLLPAHRGQTWRERWDLWASHLPLLGRLRRGRSETEAD